VQAIFGLRQPSQPPAEDIVALRGSTHQLSQPLGVTESGVLSQLPVSISRVYAASLVLL
jgi:hypothetical protein